MSNQQEPYFGLNREELFDMENRVAETQNELSLFRDQLNAATARAVQLAEALEHAMAWGVELGTADPAWVVEARAALGTHPTAAADVLRAAEKWRDEGEGIEPALFDIDLINAVDALRDARQQEGQPSPEGRG